MRNRVLQRFSEIVLAHGGWRESHAGDSGYGHFGLLETGVNPVEGALAAAREFQVALRNISDLFGFPVECGIALHISPDTIVDLHEVQLMTAKGQVNQKSFDTTSVDIDLLHRMEKVVHVLPGSNIIMSEAFVNGLKRTLPNLVSIGGHQFEGQTKKTELYLIPSDLVQSADIESLKKKLENLEQAKDDDLEGKPRLRAA